LLRQIALLGFIIGVNWYLATDERQNNDGKHVAYLKDSKCEGLDDSLRVSLLYVVNTQRSVSSLEAQKIIPNAVYYNEVLNTTNEFFPAKIGI
jgi:hypothetical protein